MQRRLDLRVLQRLEREQHRAQVALDHLGLDAELGGGLLREGAPLPRRVEVQRVDVEALAAAG